MDSKALRILLADDDLDDCDFFKTALNSLPIENQLITVNDGEQLMKYLQENTEKLPDVLFLDINMPRKNGLECLAEIKKNIDLKELPIVVFSTLKSMDKINLVFKLGGHVYVTKPGDMAQLKQVILNALPIAVEHRFSDGPLKYILNA
jgi:CheY-like chemotaxis protein